MINMGQMGFPINKEQLLDSVTIVVEKLGRLNKFSDGKKLVFRVY